MTDVLIFLLSVTTSYRLPLVIVNREIGVDAFGIPGLLLQLTTNL
ncbi:MULTISPECIES: hypothetical protein [Pseudomonas]|nr:MULTISPECIES: hypothetical protein [Pseudomonas]